LDIVPVQIYILSITPDSRNRQQGSGQIFALYFDFYPRSNEHYPTKLDSILS